MSYIHIAEKPTQHAGDGLIRACNGLKKTENIYKKK